MSLPGIVWPAIDGCPECDSAYMHAVEVSRQGVGVGLDGNGGIAHFGSEEPIESRVTFMECRECNEILIEDGEVIHEEVMEE